MMRSGSVGAKEIFLASLTGTLRMATFSSMLVCAFRRMVPSILMTPRLASSGYPGHTIATVLFFPSIWMTSPAVMPRTSMTAGSTRAMPRSASLDLASATLNTFSDVSTPITPFPFLSGAFI